MNNKIERDMSHLGVNSDDQNLDHSYEYSVINANFELENNSNYYLKNNKIQACQNIDYINSAAINNDNNNNNNNNNDYVQVNIKKTKKLNELKKLNQTNLAAKSTQNYKSDFDKLPPQIEISLYGTEILPDSSTMDAESTISRADKEKATASSTLECKARRKFKSR